MTLIQRLILNELAAASLIAVGMGGCGSSTTADATPAATPFEGHGPIVAEPTPAPASNPATTETEEPTEESAGEPELGSPCRADDDCAEGNFCQRVFTGADFPDEDGSCVDQPPVYKGRPLLVEDRPRVASLSAGGSSTANANPLWVDELRTAALEEHASIAAFARTVCQLVALGAPLSLIDRTQQALADEIRHTQGCLRWIERLGGGKPVLGALNEATAPLDIDDAALLRDVLRGGCVGETLAAEQLIARAAETSDKDLAAWLERTARDEARHAALAFETVAWLVQQNPSLRSVVAAERTKLERSSPSVATQLHPLFEAAGLTS